MKVVLNLAGVVLASRANGPGLRDVYWTAGCGIRCPGCQNPHLWRARAGRPVDVDEIAAFMETRRHEVTGVTFSGGEPTEQPRPLSHLVGAAGELGLTVVLFTGRTWDDCRRDGLLRSIVDRCDLVVAGPYRRDLPGGSRLLVASANQEVLFPTGRYSDLDLQDAPSTELLLRADAIVTGIPR